MGASPSDANFGCEDAAELDEAALNRALVEAIDQPIVTCDSTGRVVTMNAAARQLCGVGEDAEIDEASVRMLELDERKIAPGTHPVDRALAGEATIAKRLMLVAADGSVRPVQVNAARLHDAAGDPIGAAMTIWSCEGESAAERRLVNFASDIEILTEVSRLLSELHDPDEAAGIVCMVATGSTGAIAVLLWGISSGELEIERHEGAIEPGEMPAVTALTRAGALRSFTQTSAVIECHERLGGAAVRYALAWHEPLISGGKPTGVLTILWPSFLEDLERPRSLIGLLGHHAATAIERADLLRRLNEAARTDALTGVANRRVWQESLDRELSRVRRGTQPLSLVLIDLDHFKGYNDRFGHPAGDRLLCETVDAWATQLRTADLLARMGGEEFAVMLPDCDLDGALAVAERLRTSMPSGQTCSLGVVTASDGRATASELYSAADTALYRAKRDGRNRVAVAGLGEGLASAHAADALEAVERLV